MYLCIHLSLHIEISKLMLRLRCHDSQESSNLSSQSKQEQISELLTRADDLVTKQQTCNEVYAAMAESLGKAWQDLQGILARRGRLLELTVHFYRGARRYDTLVDEALRWCAHGDLGSDVASVKELLVRHETIKKEILELSKTTMNEGQGLLDFVRQIAAETGTDSSGRATLYVCNLMEQTMERLYDNRRRMESAWTQRKHDLELRLQLFILLSDLERLSGWFVQVR